MSEAYREIIGGGNVQAINKKTRWPANQELPDEWVLDGYAHRKKYDLPRINLNLEASKFVNSAVANGRSYVNWHRAWLNWCVSPWCKGQPEDQPKTERIDPDKYAIELALKGARTHNFGPDLIRRGLAKGYLTKEQAKRLGF